MTKTEELLALAEAATSKSMISVIPFRVAANPETIKQLVELVRLQHEALLRFETHYECEDTFYSCPSHETAWEDRKGECCCGADGANEAIEAFNNFERNL